MNEKYNFEDIFEQENIQKMNCVRKLMLDAIQAACQIHNVILICNPINEYSFPLIFDGANTKNYKITQKTQREGIARGFIIMDNDNNITLQRLRPIEIKLNGITYNVIKNNEKVVIKPCSLTKPTDEKVFALCDSDNRYITSDLDVLMVITKDKSAERTKILNYDMGDIVKYELDFIETLNKEFEINLKKSNPTIECTKVCLVQHGPFNRFSGTKQTHIHFPLNIFYGNKESICIGDKFNREKSLALFSMFIKDCENYGYYPDIHPNWNLESFF